MSKNKLLEGNNGSWNIHTLRRGTLHGPLPWLPSLRKREGEGAASILTIYSSKGNASTKKNTC